MKQNSLKIKPTINVWSGLSFWRCSVLFSVIKERNCAKEISRQCNMNDIFNETIMQSIVVHTHFFFPCDNHIQWLNRFNSYKFCIYFFFGWIICFHSTSQIMVWYIERNSEKEKLIKEFFFYNQKLIYSATFNVWFTLQRIVSLFFLLPPLKTIPKLKKNVILLSVLSMPQCAERMNVFFFFHFGLSFLNWIEFGINVMAQGRCILHFSHCIPE